MFALIPLCLILAAVFLKTEGSGKFGLSLVWKGAASACFVALGFLCSSGTPMCRAIIAGLILGCVADILLNLRWVIPRYAQPTFLLGILVFLGGHILYLVAVLPLCRYRLLCAGASLVLTALLMTWLFKQITAKKVFKIFGVVYIEAVVLLNCVALCNLFTSPQPFTALFFVGALLFLVSDIILILNTFGEQARKSMRFANIGLYYIGQLFIALCLLFSAGI